MKINFNNFDHLDLFTVFQKSVPPKFNKCKKCGRILKSHSKRFCGLRCSGVKPKWKDNNKMTNK